MNKRSIFCMVGISILLTGCGSWFRIIPSDDFEDRRFLSTRANAKFMIVHAGMLVSPPTQYSIFLAALPFTLVDIPISLTLDVAFLPYDQFRFYRRGQTTQYWQKLLSLDSIPITVEEARARYNGDASMFAKDWVRRTDQVTGDKIDFLAEVLMRKSGFWKSDPTDYVSSHLSLQLDELAASPKLHPATWKKLYRFALTDPNERARWILGPLAESPSIPLDYVDSLWALPDDNMIRRGYLRTRIACNPAVPQFEVFRLLEHSQRTDENGRTLDDRAMDSSTLAYIHRCR